jgi:cyclic pyranopterin phosphate synthase
MPEEGIQMMNHCDILSFEEIIEVARVAVTLGIDKFRITGGEPLVRKDIVKLIAQLSSIAGVRDLSLTTNGIFLAELAQPLKNAGKSPGEEISTLFSEA